MSKPITPAEAKADASRKIPAGVFDAVNHLLACKIGGRRSVTITQDEIIAEIIQREPTTTRTFIFANNYLDFEAVYEAAGWKVEYDKPGFNETYKAYFVFTVKG